MITLGLGAVAALIGGVLTLANPLLYAVGLADITQLHVTETEGGHRHPGRGWMNAQEPWNRMSLHWDASGIAGLLFVVAMLVWLYVAGIRPRIFRSYQLPKIAVGHGWELFSEEPRDQYVRTGVRGVHQRYWFELREHVIKGKGYSESPDGRGGIRKVKRGDTSRWTISIPTSRPLPTSTHELTSTTGVTTYDEPVDVAPELAEWWQAQNGVSREFNVSQGRVNVHLGSSINQATLFRNLDFLVGVARRL